MTEHAPDSDTAVMCPRCGFDLGQSPAGSFCPNCGARIAAARHSTGRVQSLDAQGIVVFVRDRFGELRELVGAPDDLLAEGQALQALVARWDCLAPGERGRAFQRIGIWNRAVGEVGVRPRPPR